MDGDGGAKPHLPLLVRDMNGKVIPEFVHQERKGETIQIRNPQFKRASNAVLERCGGALGATALDYVHTGLAV